MARRLPLPSSSGKRADAHGSSNHSLVRHSFAKLSVRGHTGTPRHSVGHVPSGVSRSALSTSCQRFFAARRIRRNRERYSRLIRGSVDGSRSQTVDRLFWILQAPFLIVEGQSSFVEFQSAFAGVVRSWLFASRIWWFTVICSVRRPRGKEEDIVPVDRFLRILRCLGKSRFQRF